MWKFSEVYISSYQIHFNEWHSLVSYKNFHIFLCKLRREWDEENRKNPRRIVIISSSSQICEIVVNLNNFPFPEHRNFFPISGGMVARSAPSRLGISTGEWESLVLPIFGRKISSWDTLDCLQVKHWLNQLILFIYVHLFKIRVF